MFDPRLLLSFLCFLSGQRTLQAFSDKVCDQSNSTNAWHSAKVLDLEATKAANTTLAVVGVYSTNSSESCAKDCCLSLNGTCTVASFQADLSNGTCYLYKCLPLNQCILITRNGTDTYLAQQFFNILPSQDSVTVLAAVHGDGTKSKGRKGVFPGELEETPLKHDNTSVKPRKGVQKEQNTSAVKPRKGVGIPALLDNIFSDDQTVTNSSFVEIVTPSNKLLMSFTELSNLSSKDEVVTESTTSFSRLVTTGPVYINDSNTLFTSSKPILETVDSTSVHKSKALPASAENDTDMQILYTELSDTNSTFQQVTSTKMPDVKVTEESPVLLEISNWELVRTSSSLHLVIALVLGLMLLLTVLGVVAKRIHDSWQRRHYHRMDFLIDGMYNGDP